MALPAGHGTSDATTMLPDGWPGRLIALVVTLVLLLLVWLAAVAPLLAWYQERAAANEQRAAYAAHMADIVAQAPDLQRRVAALRANGPLPASLLTGDTDAIAGARLQEIVQGLASRDGITLASTETLPAVQVGRYRRIGLRISLSAPYAVLVRLMQAILQGDADAAPRMLIDDLDVQASRLINKPADAPLEARLTVLAFRAAAAPQAPATAQSTAGVTRGE